MAPVSTPSGIKIRFPNALLERLQLSPFRTPDMVVDIKRQVKLVTTQHVIDKPAEAEGFPMRSWSVEIYLVHATTNEDMQASLFSKAVYNLHPSFNEPIQTIEHVPFRCENEGWGEFDMTIDLYTSEKSGKNTLHHDLNFGSERYESVQTINFKNPSHALVEKLAESGPVPGGEANGASRKNKGDGEKKRKKTAIDMEKLGDNLVKLQEDDLLYVVQLIHDNKTDDTYTMNDPDAGEFHVDLYTLSDNCIKLLQAYVDQKLR